MASLLTKGFYLFLLISHSESFRIATRSRRKITVHDRHPYQVLNDSAEVQGWCDGRYWTTSCKAITTIQKSQFGCNEWYELWGQNQARDCTDDNPHNNPFSSPCEASVFCDHPDKAFADRHLNQTGTTPLPNDGVEFHAVKYMIEQSAKAVFTRDRAGRAKAKAAVPTKYSVKSIFKVHRKRAEENYQAYKDELRKKLWEQPYGAQPKLAKIQPSIVTGDLLSTFKNRHRNYHHELNNAGLWLDPSVNEAILLHGFDARHLGSISNDGLQLALSNPEGLFGQGIYFAERITKADEYAVAPEKEETFRVLVAKVALGRVLVDANKTPEFHGLRTAQIAGLLEKKHCTSVIGDREKLHDTFREFIIYDGQAVQLAWVAEYTRHFH